MLKLLRNCIYYINHKHVHNKESHILGWCGHGSSDFHSSCTLYLHNLAMLLVTLLEQCVVPMSPMELPKTMEQRASNDRNRHAFEAWVQVAVSSGAVMSKVYRWTFWGFNDEMIISSLDMK